MKVITFNDKCNSYSSLDTHRQHDKKRSKWFLDCRDCGFAEVFIDMNEWRTPLDVRVNSIPHSEERRDIITTKWFN